ncbi:EAL and HDOD domain-containing protein [Legionella dresdenensis]|uniref:EAL and HDOD domain-containing protein n=1 Tax=Legionella dresdenensis TaxID=450200 RepID=A0ABV8CFY3_9GAMM
MLVKRPVYDQQLRCMAIEILANEQASEPGELVNDFTTLIQNINSILPVFVPYALKPLVENIDPPLENPIILKLHTADINVLYSENDLENSPYSIALMIDNPEQLVWINYAQYIALSEQVMAVADIVKVVRFIQAKRCKVIAYNIAHLLDFDQCRAITIDYYCGGFLFEPQLHEKNIDIASNKLNLIQLISALQNPNTNLDIVFQLIKADPLLSFQLLKVANSAAFSGYRAVNSIEQAVQRLGLLHLKNWVMVLSMKNVSCKPVEIVEAGLIRANMAQMLASANSGLSPQSAYVGGLLSVLDSLLDCPMGVLMEKITLTHEISEALLYQTGELGELLYLVINYEQGNWHNLTSTEYYGLDLSKVYIDCTEHASIGRQVFA